MATLPLIVETDFHPRRTRGGLTKPEAWGAYIPPGDWYAVRLEATGTHWEVHHRPSEQDGSLPFAVTLVSSERAFRELVGSGEADRLLAEAKAEWAAKMRTVA